MRSLTKQLNSFQSYIYSTDFSLIAITETWLSNNILDGEVLPTNYTIYRHDRVSRGGGVLLAIKHDLPSVQLLLSSEIESIIVEITSNKSFIVCVVYVPPVIDDIYYKHLSDLLFSLPLDGNVLIMGDFNLPDIDWDLLNGGTRFSSNFCDLTVDLNLRQLVVSSTHKAGNILDLILTNSDNFIDDVVILEPLPCDLSSDHYIVTFRISIPQPIMRAPQDFSLNYSRTNWDAMITFFHDYDFGELYHITVMEDAWSCLRGIIFEAISRFVPKTCSRRHPRPKWLNSQLQHQLNEIHTLRHKYKRKPTAHISCQLASAEAGLSDSMAEAKQIYESCLIQSLTSSNCSSIYKYISHLSSSHQLPNVMYLNNIQADSPSDQARLFNEYFYSVFTHSTYDLPSPMDLSTVEPGLSTINVSTMEVFQALCDLDPNKAFGIDSISPALLKYCAEPLAAPIRYLFTLSLNSHSLPQEWRTHCVVPVFKSGDKCLINNYRPISLLCIISKVLEKIVHQRLFDFLFNCLSSSQFGFIPGRSCLQQLLIFSHEL